MLKKLNDENISFLVKAFRAIDDEEFCYNFLEDLCTVSEVKAMAQRLAVAKMLDEHKQYNDIAAATGASTATISRVNRALTYGAEGYRCMLDKLGDEKTDGQ